MILKKAIQNFLPTAEGIQRLLYPYAEVVIYDLELDEIVAIYHPLSKFRAGDRFLFSLEEKGQFGLEKCIGPFENTSWDGKRLKSINSIIHDEDNKAIGVLQINLDVSKLDQFRHAIASFLSHNKSILPSEIVFKDDWHERINQYVSSYLQEHRLAMDYLNRKEKKKLIEHLQNIGAFTGKHSAHYVAKILKISRATVYNYLADLK